MPAIPNFVLKRLYVKGSLANTADGCELQLRNFVGSRTLTGLISVDVDGKRHPADALSVVLPDGRSPLAMLRSEEYASTIIEAIESGRSAVIHCNVLNTGLIDNLPFDGCVEAPVLVDGTGLSPVHFGPLPTQLAALDRAHMAVHELMVQAVLARDLKAARHALLLDPLTAAVCHFEEISSMFDEMVSAERADLAYFGA